MKITKRPKTIVAKKKRIDAWINEYSCPSCYTTFVGAGLSHNITRFKCSCGQELIIKEWLVIEELQ